MTANVDPLLEAQIMLAGIGPMRDIDGERATRLVLAILENDRNAYTLTLADILGDDTGIKRVDAIVNTLTRIATDFADVCRTTIGNDEAARLLRQSLLGSLRGEG